MKNKFVLNRKMYKEIRKMDHNQMSNFCDDLFKRGIEAGQKATEGLTSEEVKEVVQSVKGIGEKRAAIIVEAMNAKLLEKSEKAKKVAV